MTFPLKDKVTRAFNTYAAEGIAEWMGDVAPELSHVCLKFTRQDVYQSALTAAEDMGTVKKEQFNGKEISWCKLDRPILSGGLKLEWLEIIEPKVKANSFNGVTSVGYCVDGLADVVKGKSQDDGVVFRYQGTHARDLVG